MQAFYTIRNVLSVWLDQVAESMIAAIVRFKSTRTVKLIEGDDNHFSDIPDKDTAPAFDAGLQLARIRAAAHAARNIPGDPKTLAERALAQRKNDSPSAAIVLEIISQILPDDTYLTELKIDSDKLRLTGITHDAPNLIRLIRRPTISSQAAFFAPIIHSSSDPGDRFNIEARMEPDFSLAP